MPNAIRRAICISVFLQVFISLAKNTSLKLNITHRKNLEEIPSASGIERIGDVFYIIGDNSPLLYTLTAQFDIIGRVPIFNPDTLHGEVIPKAIKPDFEALTAVTVNGTNELWIFGSGAKSPEREILVRASVEPEGKVERWNLSPFFKSLKQQCKLSDAELNIEAAVAVDDTMYLFNRGKNRVIWFSMNQFEAFLLNASLSLNFNTTSFELSEPGKPLIGFSGATYLPEREQVLFTASCENTTNWIDDGDILGSYLGILDLKSQQVLDLIPITENGKILPVKIESIAVQLTSKRKASVVMVCDQDGANSELVWADLEF